MAWLYCSACNAELSTPTTKEIGDQIQVCPKCGNTEDPRYSVGELLQEFENRIKALEDSLTKVERY